MKRRVERQRGKRKSRGPLQSGHKMETGIEAVAAVVTPHFREDKRKKEEGCVEREEGN